MSKKRIPAAFAALTAVFVGRSDGVAGRPAPAVGPSMPPGNVSLGGQLTTGDGPTVVNKAAFSDKMRMVFAVGLEGSGHHYVNNDVLSELCESGNVECPNVCRLADVWYNMLSTFSSSTEYKDGLDQLRREMGTLALSARTSSAVSVATFQSCGKRYGVGEMSFPNFGGKDKPLQYVDLKILAAEAERAGIDLRFIYLSRSSKEILISTTEHRHFGSFAHEARVLLNSASVLSTSLREVHPDFLTCSSYEKMDSPAQASRVAEFVMPTKESATFFAQALLKLSQPFPRQPDTEMTIHQEGWELVSTRLQEKLDDIEREHC